MFQLRDYQIKAVEDIRNSFRRGKKKILLVSPTGSGKTIIASDMIKKAEENGKKTLYVAHRREIIMQCSRKLNEFGINHGVIMAGKSPNAFANVQIASVQTFTSRKDRDDFIKPDADLVILDEAHRSVSDSFQNLVNEYPNAFTIGMTATPIRQDGLGLGNIYEELIEAGTIKGLTEQGYLVPTRIVAPTLPDLKGLKIAMGDYEKKGLEKRMNVPKLIGDIVSHWIKFGNNRPTVVFCTSIKHSKYVSHVFSEQGVQSGHIDGEMPEIEREQALSDLRNGHIKILSCCQILNEGWDEPKISCVIIARPTKSYGLYLQMIGRSLRPFPNKKDTLVIDHSGCVYEHGFPEDVPEWQLIMTKVKTKDKQIKPIEKQPFTCVECDTVYQLTRANPECPNCNHVPTKKEKIILIKQGRLVEMPRNKKPDVADKKRFYAELLYYSRGKGYKEGWVSWVFKEKFKHFPHNKKISPIAIGKETLQFITYYNIKNAKSKKNGVHRADLGESKSSPSGINHGEYEEIRI